MGYEDSLIFDRRAEDVENRTPKGFYTAENLRIVSGYGKHISDFAGLGIPFQEDWTTHVFPTRPRMEKYLTDLKKLREDFTVFENTPALPESMDGFTYEEANHIEKMLWDMGRMMKIIPGSWQWCGELTCSEEGMEWHMM